MSETLFPRALVENVFQELAAYIDPRPALDLAAVPVRHTPFAKADLMCAVGGFRRRKLAMKDLELLYIPRIAEEQDPGDMFGARRQVNATDRLFAQLLDAGVIAKRPTSTGAHVWGASVKLAVHVATGLPLDLFAATAENYHNLMVVRTGPKDLNVLIASKAKAKGFDWKVGEAGFVPTGEEWTSSRRVSMRSERDVFNFVELPFLPADQRHRLFTKP